MSSISYKDARDMGYDGLSPFEERIRIIRKLRNKMLDCLDPDHDESPCPICGGDDDGGDE